MKRILAFTALLCLFLFSACDLAKEISDGLSPFQEVLENEMYKFRYEIELARDGILSGSNDIVHILDELNAKLGPKPQADLFYSVDRITREVSIALIKTELCGIEAARLLAIDLLDRMMAEIFEGKNYSVSPVAPLPPFVCQTNMGAINLDANVELRRTLEAVGLNLLVNKDSINAVLVTDKGDTYPIPKGWLTFSPFSVTVFLNLPDALLEKYLYLALRFGNHRDLFQLPVLPKIPRPKQSQKVRSSSLSAFVVPNHRAGDMDYQCGRGPLGWIDVNLKYDLTRLTGSLYMHASEDPVFYDRVPTIANGSGADYILYSAPPGWQIKSVTFSPTVVSRGNKTFYYRQFYRDANCDKVNDSFPTPVGLLTYIGNVPGDRDIGQVRADITFASFEIIIEKI